MTYPFKAIGMLLTAAAILAGLSACGGAGDIRDSISMEYLEAKTGKPIVYPADVDAPEVSDAFAIPQLTPGKANSVDINDLVKPPSLLPPEQRPLTTDDKTAMAKPVPEHDAEDDVVEKTNED